MIAAMIFTQAASLRPCTISIENSPKMPADNEPINTAELLTIVYTLMNSARSLDGVIFTRSAKRDALIAAPKKLAQMQNGIVHHTDGEKE